MSEYDRRRSRRKRAVKAHTTNLMRLSKGELRYASMLYPMDEFQEVTMTRGDCQRAERPCPHVGCRYHLYLDVNERNGSIKVNFPDLEVWELTESCALDVADRGGATLEETGALMNIVRERVRQIEESGQAKMRVRLRVLQEAA